MKKLAIIGASYLQNPLILKAKAMGCETHVFAWECGDIGERTADHFYPISIVEKERILEVCRGIGIDGICTIATDLGAVTVNYVANALGLTGNTMECTLNSTNKHRMRQAFFAHGDPSPRSLLVGSVEDLAGENLSYPVIVKPTDRSGSRGITKLEEPEGLPEAIAAARAQSFEGLALVEEFARGREYSVECISWKGQHRFLAMTRKFTTGAPGYIETAHLEPAPVAPELLERVRRVVFHALDSLEIRNGASHTELKIDADGAIRLIEIGGRMGGDFIGSSLVELSTGIDFVRAVVQIAVGQAPDLTPSHGPRAAAVRFILTAADLEDYDRLRREHPAWIVHSEVRQPDGSAVTDSGSRFGAFVFAADRPEQLLPYLPKEEL